MKPSLPDPERRTRIACALKNADLDAVVCSAPSDVLLLSGYWPVIGNALALATRDGGVTVLAPEDERQLAEAGNADSVHGFQPGSLHQLESNVEAVQAALRPIAAELGLAGQRIGYAAHARSQPVTYAALYQYAADIAEIIRHAFNTEPTAADELLAALRAQLTPAETANLRTACNVTEQAFVSGVQHIRPGITEAELAGLIGIPLASADTQRAYGFVFCMSGANAAQAYRAYAQSSQSALAAGDLLLVHCNSCVGGLWTDITRTFCLGEPDRRQRDMYQAVFEARAAAFAAIRPGAAAAEVDQAAREVLQAHGFGPQFKHATGHGVGFAAINGHAHPRIHPQSPDVLEAGMVFNVEPAIYIEGYGGLRHCDMVSVTESGYELLTPFQCSLEQLTITATPAKRMAEAAAR
ncbi:MAG TPA: Xaa-Pro peptidase family protein [Methylophilaceae bacterium]|nr:Xaa-Pro peptidase family protein [Methylophilaceae bacterium]